MCEPKSITMAKVASRLFAAAIAVPVLALSGLTGCAAFKKDHVEVGAIPDDYRTNHPIVLQESEQTLDVPVSTRDSQLSTNQKSAIDGFAYSYLNGGSGPIRILVPVGSLNEAAADRIGQAIAAHLKSKKAGNGYVAIDRYQAGSNEVAPIRLAYTAMLAQTGKCGRWPDDIMPTADNKHYENFGCSYQNNMAAQIANPADLLGPQGTTTIDAERRSTVIGDWRSGDSGFRENIEY